MPDERLPDGDERVAGDSLAVAGWTAVSRITGFPRVATIAAVLGPTYLGNTFLAANLLPNIAFQCFTGAPRDAPRTVARRQARFRRPRRSGAARRRLPGRGTRRLRRGSRARHRGVLLVIGGALSAGSLVAAWRLGWRLRAVLPAGEERLGPPIARALTGSVAMAIPAYLVATTAPVLIGGELRHVCGVLLAGAVGLTAFIAVQRHWRSPQLGFFVAGARGVRRSGVG